MLAAESPYVGSSTLNEPSLFISYAHADAMYVERLARCLDGFGLPVWYDDSLGWGARFTQEIRLRIRNALAVIVVMSPAAEKSEWVEREILEGQRHDREFFPILIEGSRLFLLATRHYFDAQDGSLPGKREIAQLQAVCRSTGTAGGDTPTLLLRPPHQRASTVHLSRERSLEKLGSLFQEGELEHADILTSSLLLESVQRLEAGWMRRRADGERLPIDLLARIDSLWEDTSEGKQGFRAQMARHMGLRVDTERDFVQLAQALGWTSGRGDTNPRYGAFVGAAGRGNGFFPTLRNPQMERYQSWHDQWVQTVMAVHLRLLKGGG
ncbi:TIR domain-containing protein [Frankia sp. Mgl5]|uniref:TIR domain-containing protein n=1 Tax=Frankia sp. Mgl5 TaxID=2933793 RepID=UPI00200F1FE4|nr:TIR domain-containing protein [Frankia sp. Mgl5]MCK9931537.1 TIR domain-containing protein [Frankia sp. Mgl5]